MEEKALAMFEFINAYINLREKKITNLQNEHWYKFLKLIIRTKIATLFLRATGCSV